MLRRCMNCVRTLSSFERGRPAVVPLTCWWKGKNRGAGNGNHRVHHWHQGDATLVKRLHSPPGLEPTARALSTTGRITTLSTAYGVPGFQRLEYVRVASGSMPNPEVHPFTRRVRESGQLDAKFCEVDQVFKETKPAARLGYALLEGTRRTWLQYGAGTSLPSTTSSSLVEQGILQNPGILHLARASRFVRDLPAKTLRRPATRNENKCAATFSSSLVYRVLRLNF